MTVCKQSIKPSVNKEDFSSTASNSPPIPASAETLWLIDWLPVRPPVLSGCRASGQSIWQKESQREALSPPAGTPAVGDGPLVLVNDSDLTGFTSTLESWNLHSFTFFSFVVDESLWLTDTCWWGHPKHTQIHTQIRCAHTLLYASSAAACIVIDFPALMVEALMFKMPEPIGDLGSRNNDSLLWWEINNRPFQNNCWFF